jgi:hypothetical protein
MVYSALHRCLAFIHISLRIKPKYLTEEKIMKKMKYGILVVVALLALVAVASASLPSQVTARITNPGPSSYWDVDVSVGGGDIPAVDDYIGWCSDTDSLIATPSTHTFKVISSLGSIPSYIPTMDWNKANYIINNKHGADKCTVQAAIWHYDGSYHYWCPVDTTKYNALITDANNNASYVPGPNNKYAVILWDESMRKPQPVFIEIPVPTIPSPEFPALALPVAMLIGVIGIVQYVKTRKE